MRSAKREPRVRVASPAVEGPLQPNPLWRRIEGRVSTDGKWVELDASVLSNLRDYYTHFGGKR